MKRTVDVKNGTKTFVVQHNMIIDDHERKVRHHFHITNEQGMFIGNEDEGPRLFSETAAKEEARRGNANVELPLGWAYRAVPYDPLEFGFKYSLEPDADNPT